MEREVTAAGEEAQFAASTSDPTRILMVRGKRTKRHRSASPPPLKPSSTSSDSGSVGGEDQRSASSVIYVSSSSTEEEEDMANCLILLAQGRRRHVAPERKRVSMEATEMGSRRFSDVATTTNKAGFFVYECRTCNRSFPSFQALGGHRASHKKPRPAPVDGAKMMATSPSPSPGNRVEVMNCSGPAVVVAVAAEEGLHLRRQNSPMQSGASSEKATTTVGTAGNKAAKVHECGICGAEFSSGQALGGHMRRHRASNAGNTPAAAAVSIVDSSALVNYDDDYNKQPERNGLSLDLNLPAPEDLDCSHQRHRGDQPSTTFQFASKPSPAAMVFSAPPLVGCHY